MNGIVEILQVLQGDPIAPVERRPTDVVQLTSLVARPTAENISHKYRAILPRPKGRGLSRIWSITRQQVPRRRYRQATPAGTGPPEPADSSLQLPD
jgi:hypothetical protein